MRTPRALSLALAATACVFLQPSEAGPIQFFSAARIETISPIRLSGLGITGPAVGMAQNIGQFPRGQVLTEFATQSNTTPEGSAAETASASLITGSLSASTSLDLNNPTTPYGMLAEADPYIGDTFTHFQVADPAIPFVWTTASTATFTIHVDGNVSVNPGVNQVVNEDSVALSIFSAGGLGSAFFSASGFNPCAPTTYYWSIGSNLSKGQCGQNFVGSFTPDANGNISADISFSFQPGGDFEWALGLVLGGALAQQRLVTTPAGVASWTNDFLHTATIRYTPPDGAFVESASGVFPGTVASIPEPSVMELISIGLVAIGFCRRRVSHGWSAESAK